MIEDIQNQPDSRNIPIQKVGIRDIKYPVQILTQSGNLQHTIATFELAVSLPAHVRGTHMSRFIDLLHQQSWVLSLESLQEMLQILQSKLPSTNTSIKANFPFFMEKQAPVTGTKSLMDYHITLSGKQRGVSPTKLLTQFEVPVTSLCPCSKAISQYGAHNQRSLFKLSLQTRTPVVFEDIIHLLEQQSSCELFALLKRPDEKWITERAYENAKFVEDMVRDVAVQLNKDDNVLDYRIQAENLESIHHHSAFAEIISNKYL